MLCNQLLLVIENEALISRSGLYMMKKLKCQKYKRSRLVTSETNQPAIFYGSAPNGKRRIEATFFWLQP